MATGKFANQERGKMTLILSGLLLGITIGMILGLLGGGGSILTVPALVYLIGQSPQVAVMTSLAIVGTNSTIGAYFHSRYGTMNWRIALVFGSAGMGVAYLAASLSSHFSKTALLIAFALLMLMVSTIMLLQKQPHHDPNLEPKWSVILASGLGVGFLTGLLGVGGGFLIVPALVLLVGIPMQEAVGTSLVIIAMNSLAGFVGHLGESNIDVSLTTIFIIAGFVGTFGGTHFSKRLNANQLRRLFAFFIMTLALLLLYDNLL